MSISWEIELKYAGQALPPGYKQYWVKPDWLIKDPFNYDCRVNNLTQNNRGTPCVLHFGEFKNHVYTKPVRFVCKWQFFGADLMAMHLKDRLFSELSGDDRDYIASKFSALYHKGRAFCNSKDERQNCIEPNGITDYRMLDNLICGGNTIAAIPVGEGKVRAWAFYENEDPPAVTRATLEDPRVMWATTIYPGHIHSELDNHLGWSNPIGNFGGFEDAIPYPFIVKSDEYGYYPENDLVEYSGARRSLYNPPRVS